MASQSQYPRNPDPGNYQPNFKQNPLAAIEITGGGTISKPNKPRLNTGALRSLKPAPTTITGPGVGGI